MILVEFGVKNRSFRDVLVEFGGSSEVLKLAGFRKIPASSSSFPTVFLCFADV